MVRLVTRFAKALFGQVGDQVDQVGQGKGQELDNYIFRFILLLVEQIMLGNYLPLKFLYLAANPGKEWEIFQGQQME